MKLSNFLFKKLVITPQWRPQFPSCSNQQPKTSSFRANSTDPSSLIMISSPQYSSLSDKNPDELNFTAHVVETDQECLENMIHGLKSTTPRLFFKPDETKSLLDQQVSRTVAVAAIASVDNSTTYRDKSVAACAMDSISPYSDFKKSMEDMIEAHKLFRNNWDFLEELLCWYLKVNEKENYGHIISAFVDLVLGFSSGVIITRSTGSSSSSSSSLCSASSPLSYTCSNNTINSTSATSCD